MVDVLFYVVNSMDLLFGTHLLNGLLMIGLPIGLGVYLTRKFKLGWRLWGIGAMTFILSQVGHIPFNLGLNALLKDSFLTTMPSGQQLIASAIIAGLSAGIWEEGARYATYRWWARDARSWRKGVLLGAGHGGIEAVILGILVLVSFFVMASARTNGLSGLAPADQMTLAQQQVNAYWSAPWYATLLGAVERAFTIPVQITFSVIVLQVFTRHQMRWLWLAIGWHALIDAMSVYAVSTWGAYIAEGIIGGFCVISIGILFFLRQPEPEMTIDKSPSPELPSFELAEIETTPENLEKTRYN